MLHSSLNRCLSAVSAVASSDQGLDPPELLRQVADVGLGTAVLLLTFSLAVGVVLVFAVRVLLILRSLPVPSDPVDMARPRPFRALILGATALLTPLVAFGFLPQAGTAGKSTLVVAYGCEVVIAGVAWLVLEQFYRDRDRRLGRGR